MQINKVGDTECGRKRERGIGCTAVAGPPVGAGAFNQRIRSIEQHLHHRRRSGASGECLEEQRTLLVAERNQRDSQAITLGQPRLGGNARRDARLVTRRNLPYHVLVDGGFSCHLAN